MEAFYRAKLTLEHVEPHTDSNGYTRERATEIASVNVTGDTPGDAMVQIHDHAGTLHDWHDQPAPIVDEAFPPLTPEEANQRINAAFSQLSKAAQGFLRKPPNEPSRPDDPAELAAKVVDTTGLCMAPDPNNPGWFCPRTDLHEDADCRYVPVDQLPLGDDAEGDDREAIKPMRAQGGIIHPAYPPDQQ